MDDMTIYKAYRRLSDAIIVAAINDFRQDYRSYLLNLLPNKTIKQQIKIAERNRRIEDLKQFFLSDYFDSISDINGAVLLRDLINDIEDDPERKIAAISYGKWERKSGLEYKTGGDND